MGGAIGGVVRGATDVMTLGTNEAFGNPVGKALGLGGSGGLNAPTVAGQRSPLQTLSQSGGAPLLMDIGLGADVGTSLMGYFGVNGSNANFDQWTTTLSPSDAEAVRGLHNQLMQIQNNTDTQNQAVKQLAQDYPNIMTQKIQQYQNIADPAIQKMMGQAMQQISAQQAAGGNISSGAAAEAAAQVGAQYAGQELNYATGLANQDFNQQFNMAQGLQSFQQKMLGQGAQQGFSAMQNALQMNNQDALANAGYQNQTNMYNQNQNNAMWGALGNLGGTAIGAAYGGPAGAAFGGQVGSTFMGGDAKLNTAPNAYQGSFGNNPFSMPQPRSF